MKLKGRNCRLLPQMSQLGFVLVDEMPHHVKDLRPVMGLNSSSMWSSDHWGGGCNETERQNPQTAASDEWTGVHHSKTQQVVCCICRRNSRCLHESSNHPWLDKKQVVCQTNERNEMWQWSCVNWIPFIATPKERKKQEVARKMVNLKVRN